MTGCPRCRRALVENQVDEFTVRLCAPCKGLLLLHADLTAILESSWHAVTVDAAERVEFPAPSDWQTDPKLHCPDCGQTVEKYGYMGMGAIQIDRCDRCSLVWLDAGELEKMVMALARDHYRSGKLNDPSRSMLGALYSVAAAGGSPHAG